VELIVMGFQGRYKASQVLSDLRLHAEHLFDLDNAITVSWHDRGHFIVEQNVNLLGEEVTLWAHFWGAFIKATLFQPFTELLPTAAGQVASRNPDPGDQYTTDPAEPDQWLREVGIPVDFVRDVGALIRPGGSAIVAAAENFDPRATLERMHDCGASLIYASLSAEQTNKVQAALAMSDQGSMKSE
jgi:uncharacterized membrane protein